MKESHEAYLEDLQHIESVIIEEGLELSFRKVKDQIADTRREIEKILNWVRLQNKEHLDVVAGIHPILSPFDFTSLMKDPQQLEEFYPKTEKTCQSRLLKLIRLWVALTVQQDSVERILYILENKDQNKIDKVALFRECKSPRTQIEEKDYWVGYEAEMKIQIWSSQFETFQTLMEG